MALRVLAIIPARGGSKRLAGKNMETINGRPLVRHAIMHAQNSTLIDNRNIVVTSDDARALELARQCGVIACRRPDYISQGDGVVMKVVEHAYLNVITALSLTFDVVILLQPTSPMRTPQDIDGALEMMERTGADSVVSVTEGADDLAYQVRHAGRLETIPNIVVANGAIFALRVAAMQAGIDFFNGEMYGYPMPKDRSIDIDTAQDLEIARRLMS